MKHLTTTLFVIFLMCQTAFATDTKNGTTDPQPSISIAALLTAPAPVDCACQPIKGYETTNGFATAVPGCKAAWISIFSCDNVPGAVLNDDPATANRTEYDLTGAMAMFNGGSDTRAIVNIGGSCYSNLDPAPVSYPWGGGGSSFQGVIPSRDRSYCPKQWHLPSSCETAYLAHSAGFTTGNLKTFLGWNAPSTNYYAHSDQPRGTYAGIIPYATTAAMLSPSSYNGDHTASVWIIRCIHD